MTKHMAFIYNRDMNKKEYAKQYREKNRERIRGYQRQYFAKIKEKRALQLHMGYLRNKDEIQERARERGWTQKVKVLTHYGNGKCVCVMCGFDDLRALSLDHINGGGQKHRREIGRTQSGVSFYGYLIKHGFPQGFQTLCMNCQKIKQFENKEWTKGRGSIKAEREDEKS